MTELKKRCRFPFERERAAMTFDPKKARVHASEQEACDINRIMARYENTGLLDHVNRYQGRYGDFSESPGDFHEALNQTIRAREMFMSLPARIRGMFHNDPGEFLDFATDPENKDAMQEMGLLPPAEQMTAEPSPAPAPDAPEPSSAEDASS